MPRQVSLVSCRDVFICRTCLGNNCSVEEKLEFKRGEDVLQEVEKFCYLSDMNSYYGGASEVVGARIGSVWNKFRELTGVLVGLSLKQRGKIYQCFVTPILFYCCETCGWCEVAWVERRLIRMMCRVRLVDGAATDVLHVRVGIVVKIKDMIVQSRLRWYGHVCVETSILKYLTLWKLK